MGIRRRPSVETRSVSTSRSRSLGGLYEESAAVSMAAEDSALGILSERWGENTEPRVIEAVIESGQVSEAMVRHGLHSLLSQIEARLERLRARFGALKNSALLAADSYLAARKRKEEMVERCEREGLTLPLHSLRRRTLEVLGLMLLGVGDLIFVSSAFQIFGLSAKPVFWHLNELQLAALSIVTVLLVVTRVAGHEARRLAHGFVNVEDEKADASRRARRRASTAFLLACATSLGLGTYGLTVVREVFFRDSSVAAPESMFYLIQVSVVLGAIMMSYTMAHPLDDEWRSVSWHARKEQLSHSIARFRAGRLAGLHNGLLRERASYILTHEDWSLALAAECRRLVILAARAYLAGQPEPVTEHLIAELPPVPVPFLVAETGAQLEGWRSTLMVYDELSVTEIDERLVPTESDEAKELDAQSRLFSLSDRNTR